MTLEEIVSDYIRTQRAGARAEMRDFESESIPSAAIRRATLCEMSDGKRHPHQRRIPRALLEHAETRLQGIQRRLSHAADFGALHRLVDDEIGDIKHRCTDCV